MATWVYKCLKCDNVFEKWERGLRKPKDVRCPYCNSKKITKIISGPRVFWRFAGV